MVNVRKRGKVYEYRFEVASVEGQRKWIRKSGFATKAEAFKEGAKAYNDFYYSGNKVQLRENMSYADFLDYWIDTYANFNLHYSTTMSYINIIKNHVKPRIGFYKLCQLDTRLLQEFINKIYVDYSFSKNYMASILKVIKGSLKYACYTLNYINTNPAEHVHAPRIDKIESDPAHIFTQEEINEVNQFDYKSLPSRSLLLGIIAKDIKKNKNDKVSYQYLVENINPNVPSYNPQLNFMEMYAILETWIYETMTYKDYGKVNEIDKNTKGLTTNMLSFSFGICEILFQQFGGSIGEKQSQIRKLFEQEIYNKKLMIENDSFLMYRFVLSVLEYLGFKRIIKNSNKY